MISTTIKLEKIIGNESQIKVLFQLLKNRRHNISNTSLPTLDCHIKFVRSHPYRAWYLVKLNGIYIGSAYVMENNCIGISIIDDYSNIPQILELIVKKHRPLRQIKSVRPPNFYINIAPNDKAMESQLIEMGAIKIQSTYSLR